MNDFLQFVLAVLLVACFCVVQLLHGKKDTTKTEDKKVGDVEPIEELKEDVDATSKSNDHRKKKVSEIDDFDPGKSQKKLKDEKGEEHVAVEQMVTEMKKAKKFTKEFLDKPPSGDAGDRKTLLHVMADMFRQNKQPFILFDSQQGMNLPDSFSLKAAPKRKSMTLTLSSTSDLSHGNVKDEKKLIQEMQSCVHSKKNHPALVDLKKRLARAHGVSVKRIRISKVWAGSFNAQYTVDDLANIDNIPGINAKLRREFDQFKQLKIHPLLFTPAFDVQAFDERGHKTFSRGSTYDVGPPGNTQKYTQPTGYTRYGLKVLGRYSDDKWLHPFKDPGNWYRAYHGTRRASVHGVNPVTAMGNIHIRTGFFMSNRRGGTTAAYGAGVYCSPNPKFVENGYAGTSAINTKQGRKTFKYMMQVAVNPNGVKIATRDVWVANSPADIRSYGILIKEM